MAVANPVVSISGLVKDYRAGFRKAPKRALSGLNLEVGEGETVALIGPNGAGKTTTLRILFGLNRPTSGAVTVFGKPSTDSSWRARAGYLSEFFKPPTFYTGAEFIRLMGRVQDAPENLIAERLAEISSVLDLGPILDIKIGRYSRGMMQKIGLAQALINDPDLLVLDEPTANLDAVVRTHFKEYLAARRKAGKALLISSHVLSELEQMADRAVFIFGGQVKEESTMAELAQSGDKYDIVFTLPGVPSSETFAAPGLAMRLPANPGEPIKIEATGEEAKDLAVQKIVAAGGRIQQLGRRHKTLEQQFLEWIGENP